MRAAGRLLNVYRERKRRHMATRRGRSRRSWTSSRLQRRLLEHRASIVRALSGAALLAGFWLLWPGPPDVLDSRAARDQNVGEETGTGASGSMTAAAPGSIAVSAKRQLAGEVAAARYHLDKRLRQVASAMPVIGTPEPTTPALTEDAAAPVGVKTAPHLRDDSPSGPERPGMTGNWPPALGAESPVVTPAAVIAPDGKTAPTTVAHVVAPTARVAPDTTPRRMPTWLQNAVAPAIDDRPAIAIVIDDLGVNRAGTAALNRLPAPLTLAFLPYAAGLKEQTRAARAAGHELLVHVPMEPTGAQWPGPDALTSQLGPAELISRLGGHLRSFPGFVGINNHMGSRLTADPERMAIVMAELRRHDLLFLDSRTSPESVAEREARRRRVPYAERDVFLDNQLDLNAVQRQLALVENIARQRGHAVAIGHPHQVTVEALRRWLPTLDARGLALTPISAIAARRACAEGVLAIDSACARYTATASLIQ